MEIGKRIIFDKSTGKVLNGTLEEMSGSLQEGLRPTEIDFIDLAYGDTTLQDVDTYHIDITTRKIVIDSSIVHVQTDAEKLAELENNILESEGLI